MGGRGTMLGDFDFDMIVKIRYERFAFATASRSSGVISNSDVKFLTGFAKTFTRSRE
jgi:hypothetical protein